MPIYSKNGDRVLHVHIPKTGGTSITKMAIDNGWHVEHCHTNHEGFPRYMKPFRGVTPLQHATKRVYRDWSFDYAFAVVRHPVERMKSNLVQYGVGKDQAHDWLKERFNDHLQLIQFKTDDQLKDMELRKWPGLLGWHVFPQVDYVDCGVDWCKYGTTDAGTIKAYMGTSARPHLRKAPCDKYELEPRTIEMIEWFYKDDYERFDFVR
jgi:hypothetical protein